MTEGELRFRQTMQAAHEPARFASSEVQASSAAATSLAVSAASNESVTRTGAADGLRISVIVPVRNEAPFIASTLDALLQQQFSAGAFDITVVDGESTDRTAAIVREYAAKHAQIQYQENPRRLSSAARNIGIRATRGDVVLVVDGHCQLADRSYLAKLADAFVRSGADCVGRPQPLDVTGASPLQKAIAAARSSPLGHHPDSFIYSTREGFVPAHSVAVAYRRELFDRVGPFDERFDACEDVELNHRVDRANLRCFFSDTVALSYVPRATLRGLFRQLARYGRGRVRLARKHRDTRSLKTALPAVLVLVLLLTPLVAWTIPYGITAWATLVGLYLLGVLIGSLAAAPQTGSWRAACWLPAVFCTIHWGAGCGMLVELLFGRRDWPQATAPPSSVASARQPVLARSTARGETP